MKASEIIVTLMDLKKMSKAALGRAVGINTEGKDGKENKSKPTDVINKRLKQQSIDIALVADMVDKLDYQVVVIPKGVTVKEGWYKVDGEKK